MTRVREFRNKTGLGFNLEQSEKDQLSEIALRETGGDLSKIGRMAIQEYIHAHKEGNSTFKLDNWQDNEEFKAIPSIYGKTESWGSYSADCSVAERQRLLKRINELKSIVVMSGPLK